MTKQSLVIDEETGEVLDQSALVPMGDSSSLKELVPYNRMSNIAKSTLTRLNWDKKTGEWKCSLGSFTELTIIPKAATEIFAVWTEQVGRPAYYGVSQEDALGYGEPELGYRIAFLEAKLGPCYSDFFGLSRDFAEGICKIAHATENAPISIKGSEARSTGNGTFFVPKVVR
jgi:hypothetical protein